MNRLNLKLLMACSALALGACGGTTGGDGKIVIGQEEEDARIFSTGNGDLGDVLQPPHLEVRGTHP